MADSTLRVASLNVWALPFGIAPDREARMRAIGERLQRDEADVWAFQEVWTDDAREILAEAAVRAGLRVVHGGGGLMTASRVPITRERFQPYTLKGIATHLHRGDYTGGKGFQILHLETPQGPLVLANTHLHAQYHADDWDPYYGHRTGQVVELSHALAPLTEPLIAAGDFNMREDRASYALLHDLAGLRDSAVLLDRREPTSSSDTRIDFVLVRGPRPQTLEIFAERGLYSDHAGVLAELALAPGGPWQPEPDAVAQARAVLAEGRAEAVERRGNERGAALTLTGAGITAMVLRKSTRRGFLFGSLAGLIFPAAVLTSLSAERWVAGEAEAYDQVAALLPG